MSDRSKSAAGQPVRIMRIPPRLHLSAAERLVSAATPNRQAAARRMVAAAPAHGIDLSLIWASVEGTAGSERVRQACLAVPGAGRTMMLFCSEPAGAGRRGGPDDAVGERAQLFAAACAHFAQPGAPGSATSPKHDVRLAQALPEPREESTAAALTLAGFLRVGELLYMRRSLDAPIPETTRGWPSGVSVVPVSSLGSPSRQDDTVCAAMESSYEATLDCPELCGLRDPRDVLASHKATGLRDPSLWFVVEEGGSPGGCMLLSRCPDQRSVELVYLGLAPGLRGRGIGSRLLAMGIDIARSPAVDEMTCAVDTRNTPAIALYERFGFRSFTRRLAFVKPL